MDRWIRPDPIRNSHIYNSRALNMWGLQSLVLLGALLTQLLWSSYCYDEFNLTKFNHRMNSIQRSSSCRDDQYNNNLKESAINIKSNKDTLITTNRIYDEFVDFSVNYTTNTISDDQSPISLSTIDHSVHLLEKACTLTSPISEMEYIALWDFYNSTNGPHWCQIPFNSLVGWSFPANLSDICQWNGISCLCNDDITAGI